MKRTFHLICTSLILLCTPEHTVLDQKTENFFGYREEAIMRTNSNLPWKLAWQEDFEGPTINSESWNVLEDAFGWGNRKQHLKPQNVTVEDGMLKVTTKEEWSEGMPYTSGAVTTKGKVNFQQGKIEVRAKLPSGRGILSAIWLWTENGDQFPEIDIVEILGQEPGRAWSTIHYDIRGIYAKQSGFVDLPDLTKDFHTYGIEWYSDSITFLVDGAPVSTIPKYFEDQDMYLFIYTVVGGDWVGEPDSTTEFPKEMLVDWVRYYKN
ncbi:glycoside hydrolase family 16 protein [Planococcus sp. 11815]|uniref:glycoside hydrolase family 16 protein n=1 Tax=Planococcus sp. 11815 TaxID=2939413 RepID=UPI003DA396AD